ncbi:MAG: hypothetical protein ACXAC5_02605 [Promethearchaeota archaeon]
MEPAYLTPIGYSEVSNKNPLKPPAGIEPAFESYQDPVLPLYYGGKIKRTTG